MRQHPLTLTSPRPSQASAGPAATSEITSFDPPETFHPAIPHPHPTATPGANRDPANRGTVGTPTAPPPTVCWADALGPNETFSSPTHTPAHSPSYSPLSSPRDLPDADGGPPEPNPRADVDSPSREAHQGGSEGAARWWEGAAVTQLETSLQREAIELAAITESRLSHIIPNALPPLENILQWVESRLRGELLEEDELVIRDAVAHFRANTPMPYVGPIVEPTLDSTAQSAAVALRRRIRRITGSQP